MGVLVMLELDGDTEALLAAVEDLERRLGEVGGMLARVVAPTEDGVVVVTQWASPEARQANQDAPGHDEALQASGLLELARDTRSRAFHGAELTLPPPPSL